MNKDDSNDFPEPIPNDTAPVIETEPQDAPAQPVKKQRKPRKSKNVVTPTADSINPTGPGSSTGLPGGDPAGVIDFGVEFKAPDAVDQIVVVHDIRFDNRVPRALRFFTPQGVRRQVHWVTGTEEHGTECVECLGPDCILCQTRRKVELRNGMPVLDLETLEVGLLAWGSKPQVSGHPRPGSMPDLVRTGIHAPDPKILTVEKLGQSNYRFKMVPMKNLVGLSLGDAEIAAYLDAVGAGRRVIQVAKKYDREQILKRFPEIGRAAAIGQRVHALQQDANGIQMVKDLYGEYSDDGNE